VSYDLQVYSQEALSSDSLRELVTTAGLGVEDADGDTGALTVVRGAKGRYCFTLGLPVAVELEDVPEEVTAVLLAPAFTYELLVEGSSPTETPHAVRFARRLAQAPRAWCSTSRPVTPGPGDSCAGRRQSNAASSMSWKSTGTCAVTATGGTRPTPGWI
jgi:hypothetical protein